MKLTPETSCNLLLLHASCTPLLCPLILPRSRRSLRSLVGLMEDSKCSFLLCIAICCSSLRFRFGLVAPFGRSKSRGDGLGCVRSCCLAFVVRPFSTYFLLRVCSLLLPSVAGGPYGICVSPSLFGYGSCFYCGGRSPRTMGEILFFSHLFRDLRPFPGRWPGLAFGAHILFVIFIFNSSRFSLIPEPTACRPAVGLAWLLGTYLIYCLILLPLCPHFVRAYTGGEYDCARFFANTVTRFIDNSLPYLILYCLFAWTSSMLEPYGEIDMLFTAGWLISWDARSHVFIGLSTAL